ncbi:cytochrome c-type biogenesis protein CcmE [Hyphomonas neptunium ATCC 15444]|uniref:Cytochrome c-type biogenesis protein CcmE n=2 Tax=Hyphomonas TaxID=85 RepID=CCME_HYPNA|nr:MULTISPECIES: cytochrome c maturation protein CcmE [Hyphomonas]Q0C2L6.1 RecName: Full=Cytochrome c-type biogenesis protein CcmE; AltName: Full=Cytochrome c maturation protein E; AltName: Full=Heme chaperone CcmE [Hyphomonas neptunium ATCC 15444]ABI75366.1 cytochrome c-type biogenesis protein CcmE [Hyphomonas neptunium ATCC 15444]KCZ95738.1 cytochrome c-type biogenesis protein CcmE [Hyphomonas hirschiana VP5]
MRARTRRLYTFGIAAALIVAAAALAFFALRENANLFYTPEVLAEKGLPREGREVKVGGWVEPGSLTYADGGATMRFTVIDNSPSTITVSFNGVAPDLFREGQGVVATGTFTPEGEFTARQLLAKHDENYQPRELKPLEAGG